MLSERLVMSEYEKCECGEVLEWIDNAWATYGMSYEAEIIDIYECTSCDKVYSKRRGQDDLEEYD